MGVTKRKSFESKINSVSDVFKALGHPARVQVLTILLEKKMCTCGEIVSELPISQSTVSKHLIELKKVGLIGEEFDGKKTIFFLKKDSLLNTNEFLSNFIYNCKKYEVFEKISIPKSKNKKSKPKQDIFLSVNTSNPQRRVNKELKKYNYIFKHLELKKTT